MSAEFELFGTTEAGELVHRVTLRSETLTVSVLTWGAVVHDVRLVGVDYPLTLGSPQLAAYAGRMNSFGALMGPVANRIRGARAPVAGQEHRFEANIDGQHTLHGGSHGTQSQVWTVLESSPAHVLLECELADGLSGFPGHRTIRVDYRVTGARLDMVVTATTSAPTLLNLANHSYWNLDGSDRVADHSLWVPAEERTESDVDLMVTGARLPVAGTRFDFREPRRFGCGPEARFDLNYCVAEVRRALTEVCRLRGTSGLEMVMSSTEPGLQVFDLGSFDTAPFPGHGGAPYASFSGIALEAQGWPDAANHPGFPSIEVTPAAPYHQHTAWAFERP